MKKLKLVMSDQNFINAMVHDEDGDPVGYIGEVSIRAKRKILFIRLGGNNYNISSEDMAAFRDVVKSALQDSSDPNPFVIFGKQYEVEVGTVILDDYQVDNAKIIAKSNGEWLSEEELIVKDIIE